MITCPHCNHTYIPRKDVRVCPKCHRVIPDEIRQLASVPPKKRNCKKCNHDWTPRQAGRPERCPRCHSTFYVFKNNPTWNGSIRPGWKREYIARINGQCVSFNKVSELPDVPDIEPMPSPYAMNFYELMDMIYNKKPEKKEKQRIVLNMRIINEIQSHANNHAEVSIP
jgi:hypothetical protein